MYIFVTKISFAQTSVIIRLVLSDVSLTRKEGRIMPDNLELNLETEEKISYLSDVNNVDTLDEFAESYSNIMNKYPTISSDETRRLFLLYNETKDKKIRETLIYSNFRLVYKIAQKYLCNYTDPHIREDIKQNGIVGLIKAVDTFDITKGFTFGTYATRVIKGYIHNELNNYSFEKLIALPRSMTQQRKIIRQFINDFAIKNEKEPTTKEISDSTGIPYKKIDIINELQNGVYSYDEIVYTQEDNCLVLYEYASEESIENDYEKKELCDKLHKIISRLLEKERIVITMRYLSVTPYTYKEIAGTLGLTINGVRCIEKRALLKMKNMINNNISSKSS